MTENEATELLDQLQKREVKELYVTKEDFMLIRGVLIQREDFKHFRGNAQRGGDVIYTYLDEARS